MIEKTDKGAFLGNDFHLQWKCIQPLWSRLALKHIK